MSSCSHQLPTIWEYPILVVEDDPGLASLISGALEDHGFTCELLETGAATIARLTENHHVIMLLDYTLPDMTGSALAEKLAAGGNLPPFIMITGREDAGLAVSMMKLGARDYVLKDLDFLDDLPATVIRVIQELQTENRLKEAIGVRRPKRFSTQAFSCSVGASRSTQTGASMAVVSGLSISASISS